MNRATRGQLLFRDPGDYLAFQALLAHALRASPLDHWIEDDATLS